MPAAAALKTLIVDDQQTMRSLIRTSLHALGITQTREAPDGEEALRAMLSLPVNLVITDFNMPKLDGLGLLRAIRAHGPTSKTAVIMLTGRADKELVQRAVQFGVNNYLVKPFTTQTLKEKIEAVFGTLDMIVENVSNRPGKKIHVIQGEHAVSSDPDVMLTTILGSCVAVCLRDKQIGFGGMNHFLLPEGKAEGLDEGRRYGAFAMELLINEILRSGGRRERMEAKLFGGARMFGGLSDVGASNAAFAEKFMRDEGIPVVGGSLGGFGARRVQYWPSTGRAQQRTVTDTNEVARLREVPVKKPVAVVEDEGDLELF